MNVSKRTFGNNENFEMSVTGQENLAMEAESNIEHASHRIEAAGNIPEPAHHGHRRHRRISRSSQTAPNLEATEDEALAEEENRRKYGASHVIKLFVPVTICMLLVVIVIRTVEYYSIKDVYLIYTPFHSETTDTGTLLWESIVNAIIFIGVVAVMTCVLLCLFKYRCYKLIYGWLVFSSLLLLFVFAFLFLGEVLATFNLPADYITVSIVMWNFGVVGMIAIHWKSPLLVTQSYLIATSALMALVFIKYLPDWTTWTLLIGISLWDLFAVLTSWGPLRKLVQLAQERNEPLFPALIYSSGVMYALVGMTEDRRTSLESHHSDDGTRPLSPSQNQARVVEPETVNIRRRSLERHAPRTERETHDASTRVSGPNFINDEDDDEEGPVRLGLGDFIFYSVLVGKASTSSDWNTIIACFIAILIGLCLTLILLAVHQKALPALPISLILGVIFFFLTSIVMKPFTDALAVSQVFI